MAGREDQQARRISALRSPIVKILVGREAKEYYIHRNLLCAKSDYFRKALSKGFKEAELNEIVLDEDEPEVFEAFVYWLYYGKLADYKEKSESGIDRQTRTSISLTQMQLVNIWIFGDMRKIPGLQNQALRDLDLHLKETDFLWDGVLSRICTGTLPGAPIRRFAQTMTAGLPNTDTLFTTDAFKDASFSIGVCRVLLEIRDHCSRGIIKQHTALPVTRFFVEEKNTVDTVLGGTDK